MPEQIHGRYHDEEPSPDHYHSVLIQEIRVRVESVAVYMARVLPVSRETEIAQKRLEEALFWAWAAIRRDRNE